MKQQSDDVLDPVTVRVNALNTTLRDRYVEVLQRHDLDAIKRSEQPGVLSGVFLPAVNAAYLQSSVRIMLIGQEPKKWGEDLYSLGEGIDTATTVSAYVQRQMERYIQFAATPARRSRFRQFHGHLHASVRPHVAANRNAIYWGNLLCMSRKQASPRKAAEIVRIAALSRDLLREQFAVLQPHLVVFTTGHGYDRFLKQQVGAYQTRPGLKAKHYWPFDVSEHSFMAWRVRHPRRLTSDIKRELFSAVSNAAPTCCQGRVPVTL